MTSLKNTSRTFLAAMCAMLMTQYILFGFPASLPPLQAAEPAKRDILEPILVPGDGAKHVRTLSFPKNFSLGDLTFGRVTRPAQGKVVIPAGQSVRFVPGKSFLQNPGIINTLAADSFDRIDLALFSLEETDGSDGDRILSYIGHLKGLLGLNVDRSDTTDVGLAHAAQLPHLQNLSAFQAAIEGKCLAQFATLKHLNCLNLGGNHLQEDNLKYLKAIPALRYLYLDNCQISDTGIKNLSNCSELLVLHAINNRNITDRSIKYLLGMKKLLFLRLQGTSITIKGALQLKALPLKMIDLPGTPSKAEHDQVARAFPGVWVKFSDSHKNPVDSETKKLFAPLH